MTDIYNEQMVRREGGAAAAAKKAAVALGAFTLTAVSFVLFYPATVFVLCAAVFACWYLFSFFDVEYEYGFTSGELDFDVIFAKRRRKRLASVDVRSASAIRKLREGEMAPKAEKVIDCTSGAKGGRVYVITCKIKNAAAVILFEPNDDLLKAIAPFAGRTLQK
jgi:hypothetical protein